MICSIFKRKRRVDGKLEEAEHWSAQLCMDWERSVRRWSLGTTDKREAERLLHEERVKVEKRHHGLLAPESVTEAAEQPLGELLDAFLVDIAVNVSTATLDKYQEARRLFAACGWHRLADVNERSFHLWRKTARLSPKTIRDRVASVGTFYQWLRRNRMVLHNPLEFVRIKVPRVVYRRAESPANVQRLLSVAAPHRAAVYLVALQTGLRRKELEELKESDFELDAPQPFVRVPASITKNRKEATIWLRPEVVAVIRHLKSDSQICEAKIFKGLIPRLPRFRADLELAGIPFLDGRGRRFDFHALRVTFGTNLSAAGVAPRIAMELLRHSDIKLTMNVYTDAAQLPTSAAMASLPGFTVDSGAQIGAQTGAQTGVAGVRGESQVVAYTRTG